MALQDHPRNNANAKVATFSDSKSICRMISADAGEELHDHAVRLSSQRPGVMRCKAVLRRNNRFTGLSEHVEKQSISCFLHEQPLKRKNGARISSRVSGARDSVGAAHHASMAKARDSLALIWQRVPSNSHPRTPGICPVRGCRHTASPTAAPMPHLCQPSPAS